MKYYLEYTKEIYNYYNRLPYRFEKQPKQSKPRWIWLDMVKKELYVTWLTIQGQYTAQEQKEREKQGIWFQKYQQRGKRSPSYTPFYRTRAKQWAEIHWYIYITNHEDILTNRESYKPT